MSTNAKRPAWLRALPDVAMVALTAALFSRNVTHHVIAAVALIALFVVRFILNRRQVQTFLSERKAGAAREKIIAALNCLLALAWLAVFVTGAIVSERAFPFRMGALNSWHYFSCAVTLLLSGVYFGMYWSSFWGRLHEAIPLPKAAAAVLLAVVLIFGCYSLYASSYVRWISAPFTAQQMRPGRMRAPSTEDEDADVQGRGGRWNGRGGDEAPDAQSRGERWNGRGGDEAPDAQNRGERWNGRDGDEAPDAQGRGERWNGRGENGERNGQGREGRWNAQGRNAMQSAWGRGGRGAQPFSIVRLLNALVTCFSLLTLFAAATHGVELLVKRKKKDPADEKPVPQTEE